MVSFYNPVFISGDGISLEAMDFECHQVVIKIVCRMIWQKKNLFVFFCSYWNDQCLSCRNFIISHSSSIERIWGHDRGIVHCGELRQGTADGLAPIGCLSLRRHSNEDHKTCGSANWRMSMNSSKTSPTKLLHHFNSSHNNNNNNTNDLISGLVLRTNKIIKKSGQNIIIHWTKFNLTESFRFPRTLEHLNWADRMEILAVEDFIIPLMGFTVVVGCERSLPGNDRSQFDGWLT